MRNEDKNVKYEENRTFPVFYGYSDKHNCNVEYEVIPWRFWVMPKLLSMKAGSEGRGTRQGSCE